MQHDHHKNETTINIAVISATDVESHLHWKAMVAALRAGHRLARPQTQDVYLERQGHGYFNRCAWIETLGLVTKSVTVFPDNRRRQPALPSVQGAVLLFDDTDGAPLAVIDGALVTKWKTTADSLLGARLLARPDSRHLLVIGAGAMAASQLTAYPELFPGITRITIWNRTTANASALATSTAINGCEINVTTELASAVANADIITCATMSTAPLLCGDWVAPGTHVDLVGAFRPTMREADDTLLQKARLYVDSRESTLHDIGELCIPLASGAISEAQVLGDLYELCHEPTVARRAQDITVFKNGGGAHLDLMCARLIYDLYLEHHAA